MAQIPFNQGLGVLPDDVYEEASHKGGTFFRLEHYLKQLGFHELKYREGQGKLSFRYL